MKTLIRKLIYIYSAIIVPYLLTAGLLIIIPRDWLPSGRISSVGDAIIFLGFLYIIFQILFDYVVSKLTEETSSY